MWIGWLTCELDEAAPRLIGAGAPPDPATCRFLAAASDQAAVDAVLKAARDVLLMTRTGLDPARQLSPEGEYVYAYFDEPDAPSWDGCFYIGKGIGSRWTQHVWDRAGAQVGPAMTEKQSRIDAWVGEQRSASPRPLTRQDLVGMAQHRLVRIIGHWSGPHAAACAFAAEYVLIRGFLGAYQLGNLTGGNDRSKGVRLLVQEAGLDPALSSHANGWARAVNSFARNPDDNILDTRIRPLLHLLANAPLLSDLDARLAKIGLAPADMQGFPIAEFPEVPAHYSAEGAADPCVSYIPQDGRPIRIQLKLSMSQAAAFINIRPRKDTPAGRDQFARFMATVAPNGASLSAHYGKSPLRNPGQPYFKPFATDGSGRADTVFPLREEEGPVPSFPNWAPGTPPLRLVEALRLFLGTFQSGV